MKVRLATQNFEMLGTPKRQELPPPGPESEDRFTAALDHLERLDADLVVATEIPSEKALEELSRRMGEKAYPHRRFVVTNDPTGHHMAVLSRHPLGEVRNDRDAVFSRSLLMAEVQVPGYPLRVYGVHYKADPFHQGPQSPEKNRRAQAMRRQEIDKTTQVLAADLQRAPRAYALLGDGNTTPDSPEMQALLKGQGAPLADPLAAQPEAVTHPATGTRKDYVLVDPATLARVESAAVLPAASVGQPPDHNPTVVELDLSP